MILRSTVACALLVAARVLAEDVHENIVGDLDLFMSIFADVKLERIIEETDPRFFLTEVNRCRERV